MPAQQLSELSIQHPIFHAFFDIATLDFVQYYDRGTPELYGMFEDNDATKRLQGGHRSTGIYTDLHRSDG